MKSRTYEILTKIVVILTLLVMIWLFVVDGLSVEETTVRMLIFIGLIFLVRRIERKNNEFLEKENQRLRLELRGWEMKD